MANETQNKRETELRDTKAPELREQAKQAGIEGAGDLHKEELVQALLERDASGASRADAEGSRSGTGAGEPGDAGPDGGHVRTGEQTSKSIKYSQEITSPDEDPERPGRSLVTTSHEVIRQWAEERGGTPATVDGTEHGDHLGVLRFVFNGDKADDRLREVSWDEWFETFDARELNFLYQEERKDGRPSTFFRFESPHREDA